MVSLSASSPRDLPWRIVSTRNSAKVVVDWEGSSDVMEVRSGRVPLLQRLPRDNLRPTRGGGSDVEVSWGSGA
jgi:hypothetical protein